MAYELEQIGDDFLTAAPLVIPASVELPNTPEQVWEALASERMWSWLPVIDNLRWVTPPGAPGCIRELRIARAVTVTEEFYRWEPLQRATFRVTHASRRALKALAEDFVLEQLEPAGTRLTWTMAVAPAGPRPPRVVAKALAPGNGLALRGIRKILPPA